jgi:hypothetical protein
MHAGVKLSETHGRIPLKRKLTPTARHVVRKNL